MATNTMTLHQILGGPGDDHLVGTDGNDIIQGGAGNDYLAGGLGNDVLLGGAGDDVLGAPGAPIPVEQGNDVYDGGPGNDTFGLNPGNDVIKGGSGIDTIFTGRVFGGTIDLRGGPSHDAFGGTDTITGVENVISGWAATKIIGNASDNLMEVASVDSVMTGNGGRDIFRIETGPGFGGPDPNKAPTITDFHSGQDRIQISQFFFQAMEPKLGKISPDHFGVGDHGDGNDWVIYDPARDALYVSGDGTHRFEMVAHLNHGAHVTASDLYIV